MDTALGAFGALDVVLRRSMEGLNFWQRFNDSSESARKFYLLVDLQHARLATWKKEWGIEPNNNYRQDHRFRDHQQRVMRQLQYIHATLNDFAANLSMPELLLTQSNASISTNLVQGLNHQSAFSGPRDGVDSGTPTLSSTQGIQWALREDRLEKDLDFLTKLVDGLYSILPPPRHDPARHLVLSNSLTSLNPNDLTRIGHMGINPAFYAVLVWVNSCVPCSNGAQLGNHQLQTSLLSPIDCQENRSKFMARYQGELVLAEKKVCTAAWGDVAQLNVLKARIDQIVTRLQTPKKPTELSTLPCRGSIIIRDNPTAEDRTTWTYIIIYSADHPHFTSLRNLLSQKKRTSGNQTSGKVHFSLGKRFALARTLGRAVMYLHLANWLHKAIRSENIVFFIDEDNHIRTHLPYIVGFEYSRLDVVGEQTENAEDKPDHRYYRHPRAMAVPVSEHHQVLDGPGRYSKAYDIYSMGVVLLEIGRFMSAKSITEAYGLSKHATLEDVRNVFIEKAIPDLRLAMGDVYVDAVLICLNGSLDNLVGQSLDQAFYENVVCQLDMCSA
ncbi:hypothetical protein GQ607_015633 [Colletotrichum asianum]|uniref:Protein kinase domain-containing protein n=1 Tax=Colletotrichum asianum TaxID=702518 RepID=A0A8H3VV84_9PEZI|nr:hypothetical protein GQ607_015633 [Colletotrichum asianum]